MENQITLTGPIMYNPSYPPSNAKKGYVARITGRVSGPMKYEREFLGSEVTLIEGDEGLYERQVGSKKGGYSRYYYVILSHPDHGMIISTDCEDDVPKIAKLLDDGVSIADAVEVTDLRPSEKTEGRMIFTAIPRTKTQAKSAAKAQTIDSATDACWEILQVLPEKEAKKVLAELRKRIAQ